MYPHNSSNVSYQTYRVRLEHVLDPLLFFITNRWPSTTSPVAVPIVVTITLVPKNYLLYKGAGLRHYVRNKLCIVAF